LVAYADRGGVPTFVPPFVSTVQVRRRMSEHEPRNSELRINEADREAIKAARDEHFDASTSMGLVCRIACEQMVETEETSGGIHL